mmetsp:Transcript_41342/g.119731  ORF Transcript_41342/g.119731 Transcript_41342/m.119731 type:complete len:754 (+) Transcript_41342:173-2434(+)|eukprot:CAMPEP_0170212932 /NCGR_PEP_ID=MMETSP0116_2-20130129/6088_1 /TAXON_ID=400756 /ORGANISM="Durinskia baltica, Strain CSIRO CS-38" /LENGTH=753 /DNA_ID=CAMNT_0010463479 /DNA_START=165 /DNA_END=2426 /DNA_ORIENTATION=-
MITQVRILSRRLLQSVPRKVPRHYYYHHHHHQNLQRLGAHSGELWGHLGLASALAVAFTVWQDQDSLLVLPLEPHKTQAQASSHSTHFQLQAALEFKEEFKKVKLARFLNELTQLAAKTRGGTTLQKFQTEWGPMREGMDLHGIDLEHLTNAEALYLIDKIQNGERLQVQSLMKLCETVAKLLKTEPTLVEKKKVGTVTIVGDLHGSLPSLQAVLELAGDLDDPNRCLIFDGDFVDRGHNSLEVFMILLLLKIAYPKQVILVRGNHEDSMVAKVYGFWEELKQKYALGDRAMEKLWKSMSETFAALPLAVVTDTAFIVHGGLPSKEFRLDHLRKVSVEQRCQCHTLVQPMSPLEKMIESLLWSDPSRRQGIHPSPRGTGVKFGHDVAKDFLTKERIKYIVRGHEPVEHGILEMDCGDSMKVITVFSASNYPNEEGHNVGAILKLTSDGSMEPVKFGGTQKKPEEESFFKTLWDFAGKTEKSFYSMIGSSLSGSSQDKLRQFVTEHQSQLVEAFTVEEKDGLVTKQQWISVMRKVLDLPDVGWDVLQPQVAPTTEPKGDFINWREYLIENTTGIVEALSDKEKMGDTVDHMDKMLVIFQYLDLQQNGIVGRQEFIAGTRILNRLHLPKRRQIKDPDALFAQFDDDGNGLIGFKEFEDHLHQSHLLTSMTTSIDKQQAETLAKNHELLKMAFEFLDRDGSGTITFEKWKVGIELLNKQLGPHEKVYDAKELFTLMDVDGRGSIDLDEFNELFGSL